MEETYINSDIHYYDTLHHLGDTNVFNKYMEIKNTTIASTGR